jgi:hypothetical protein
MVQSWIENAVVSMNEIECVGVGRIAVEMKQR